MKIVYIIGAFVIKGGAERILSEKANYFADKCRYDVTIVICTQYPKQSNAYYLSNAVKQIFLDIPLYSQYKYKYPMRLWIKRATNNLLRKSLTKCIQSLNPDYLIGMGHFKANMICSIDCRAKKIIECHEARYFTQSSYANHQSQIIKLFTKFYRKRYFRTIEKKADVVVTLTEGDKLLWSNAKRIEVIPNFSEMKVSQISSCNSKRIIAVGRLSWEKGYDRLIDIWEIVTKIVPDWKLDIYGEGELGAELNKTIEKRNIQNISIHPVTNNISHEYSTSSICVMTSYFEGFALVLLEALKHGVPCIAFDCPFGPASIIEDGKCGYIINEGNISLFAEKLRLLMSEEELRKEFSKESLNRADYFAVDTIMKKWIDLFESLH